MPDIAIVKKPKPEVLALSALIALGGLGMVLLFFRSKTTPGHGELKPTGVPGELMSMPISQSLEGSNVYTIRIGNAITVARPTVLYIGPGRDTYTYAQVKQRIAGQMVTVMGSGVAGVHVGPPEQATEFQLVSPQEPQPPGCIQSALCMYVWPGPPGAPNICGAAPQPGYGDVYLEIYQNSTQSGHPQDADGFSSPTCGSAANPIPRVPIIAKVYRSKVLFTV